MPVARYFLFVGAALLALLFVADAYLPKPPGATVTDAAADLPMIRIKSDRKWPERVVFDTTIPAISPVQIAAAVPVQAPATVGAPARVADVSAKVREAFAQLQPPDTKQVQPSVSKTPAPAPAQPKRKMAKKHVAPPMVLVAQQQQQQRPFGFFANSTW